MSAPTPLIHGTYAGYSKGCRCDACKAARAEYQRGLRNSARTLRDALTEPGEDYVAQGIQHGISGYSDRMCRCPTCRAAKSKADQRHAANHSAVAEQEWADFIAKAKQKVADHLRARRYR